MIMQIHTINPTTEELLQTYPLQNKEQITALIDAAHLNFCVWKTTTLAQRALRIRELRSTLERRQEALAELITAEMGKPLAASRAEIEKCALLCEHYAQHGEAYLADKEIKTEMKKTFISYQPLGIILGIMPWNFPFWQVFRFVIPAIMAGNAVIFKHSPNTTGCGLRMAELFIEAGFPEHLCQSVIVDNEIAAYIIAHDKIAGVSFTGSEQAGKIVAANASNHLKPTILELGGSDPYIVLEDADLELAAQCIVTSRLSNSGQVCIAAKRTIVVETVAEELKNKISALMDDYQMGNPFDANTKIGPLARADLRDHLHQQVLKSIQQGAVLQLGGTIPNGKGFFYPPTLITNVCPNNIAFDEELFGPVIAMTKADNEAHAIWLANQSKYGLSAAIFTSDLKKGQDIATNQIEAGSCFVNAFVVSDPRVPFGGIKHSGYGRELSQEGILAFANKKVVSVA
jgi:succinate-semialdehyde dehydrogenase/glutarate-semialdehyde dehydrogenase